jgi:hypothetical protein
MTTTARRQPRVKLSEKVRLKVFKRDAFTCVYCGCVPERPQVDHVVPVTLGGPNDMDNLVTACPACNTAKGPMPLPGRTLSEYAQRIIAARYAVGRCPYHGTGGVQVGAWTEEAPCFTLEACGVSGCPPWRAYEDGTGGAMQDGDLAATWARPT